MDIHLSNIIQFTQLGVSEEIPDFMMFLTSLSEPEVTEICTSLQTLMVEFSSELTNVEKFIGFFAIGYLTALA